jgi:hypothetical protein
LIVTTSSPDRLQTILRIEGLCEFALALALYEHLGGSWPLFALLILTPDLSALGYLVSARVGAAAYNAVHSYVGPALAGLTALLLAPAVLPFALIWAAHIAGDRALGYGLKSEAGFRITHLGVIGRKPA